MSTDLEPLVRLLASLESIVEPASYFWLTPGTTVSVAFLGLPRLFAEVQRSVSPKSDNENEFKLKNGVVVFSGDPVLDEVMGRNVVLAAVDVGAYPPIAEGLQRRITSRFGWCSDVEFPRIFLTRELGG